MLVSCNDKYSKDVVDNFNTVRMEISDKIQFLIDQLREREGELFQELNEFEINYRKKQDKRDNEIESLNNMRDITESILEGSELVKSLRKQHLPDIELKLNEIRLNSSDPYVTLSWNEDILHSVRNLGRIEIREKIRYQNKINPILTASRKGNADGEMNNPYGIAIEAKSSNIFIADHGNQRVQVFDQEGQYLYKFGEDGAGKLNFPWGIAIGNDKVYISQLGPKVYFYKLNGEFIGEFGNNELSDVTGIAISQHSGDIFVCDWSKNMIFVYSQDLEYKTSFGEDKLYDLQDIKITQDNRIFVLDRGNPCIHIFNIDLSYSHSIVSRGTGNAVGDGWFFTLDNGENILISDYNGNVISVFNERGELIHQIGNGSDIFYRPKGIAIDSRIIVVDEKLKGTIKFL